MGGGRVRAGVGRGRVRAGAGGGGGQEGGRREQGLGESEGGR